MRKLLLLYIFIFSLTSCTKDDLGNAASRNTVSDSEVIEFEELTLLINIQSGNDYLVVESIDSVSIFVNDLHWSITNSETINTDLIDKNELGNMYVTNNKLNYLVIASQDVIEPDYTTAGDFAQYLNANLELTPGDYVCFIESFQVTLNDGSVHKHYPFEYLPFRVEQNLGSVFVGEFELNIN